MLLRVYRLTDKFGIVLIKLGAATVDWLLDGVAALVNLTRRSTGGIFGVIFAAIMSIAGFLWWILKGLGRVFMPIFGRFGGATGRAVSSGARVGGR